MSGGEITLLIFVGVIALFVLVTLARSILIVPQAQEYIIERLGRYQTTLGAGLHLLVPFIDRIRQKVDMREQVVSFPPQPVITSDNLVVSIDTVLYFQVMNSAAATYQISNVLQGIEQLTVTTLRNVIGSMDLERTLTSREEINRQLRGVLDEATTRWGIRVNRVELKAIEPPPSIRDSMEKQMRAERDRRAAILQAEGHKQAQILTAEGDKQAAILRAQGSRESQVLNAEGQAKAIRTVADAIHRANPDPKLLAYLYLQALPEIAQGQANTLWILPSEITRALEGIGGALGKLGEQATDQAGPQDDASEIEQFGAQAEAAAQAAQREAEDASREARESVRNVQPTAGATSTLAGAGASGDSEVTQTASSIQTTPALPEAPGTPASTVLTQGVPPVTAPPSDSGR